MSEDSLKQFDANERIVVGLNGLDTLTCEIFPDIIPVMEMASDLGIHIADSGFPELMPNAGYRCAQLREVLQIMGDRIKVIINVPVFGLHAKEDLRSALECKLRLLGIECAELCSFGPIGSNLIEQLKKAEFSTFLEQAISDGLIARSGLWIADRPEVLVKAMELSPMISYIRTDYTPLDFADRPGSYGLKIAREAGLRLLLSGTFPESHAVPEPVLSLWKESQRPGALSEQLIRWTVQSNPDAAILLPAHSLSELNSLIKAAGESGSMSVRDKLLRNNLRDASKKSRPIACTACGCCMPCPVGLDIPGVLALYNDAHTHQGNAVSAIRYKLLGHNSRSCVRCGRCDTLCPKAHPVSRIMSNEDNWLSGEAVFN